MKWHTFGGPEIQSPAPDFCLRSDVGDVVCNHVYRQRVKQVLVFPSGSSQAEWTPVLQSFADHAEDIRRSQAVLLGLVPAEQPSLEGIGRDLPVHFPILADEKAQMRQEYDRLLQGDTGTSHLVFVLDTYGAPYAAAVNANPADPALYDQISQWLTFISIQCPE